MATPMSLLPVATRRCEVCTECVGSVPSGPGGRGVRGGRRGAKGRDGSDVSAVVMVKNNKERGSRRRWTDAGARTCCQEEPQTISAH